MLKGSSLQPSVNAVLRPLNEAHGAPEASLGHVMLIVGEVMMPAKMQARVALSQDPLHPSALGPVDCGPSEPGNTCQDYI